MFRTITTFNRRGLEIYGEAMINSMHRHWPTVLTVYAEGWSESSHKARVIDLLDAVPWLADFKRRHAALPTKNYRMDVVRFSHKVAAIVHAARQPGAHYLIWVDGDTIAHASPTVEDLQRLAPSGNEWIALLDRRHLYPECGFMIFDCRHPRHAEMINRLEEMYAQDEFKWETEWHDSHLLWTLILRHEIRWKSLSGKARTTMHPLINSELGRWLDHKKGARKFKPRSMDSDLKVRRDEAYWNS